MITVTPIKAFSDNYIWCLQASVTSRMQARDSIDPQDPVAVFAAVRGWKDNF